ncbi:uridine-cytidine kinase-like 1 isoform X3 [Varroa jacobsoni]|uniref:uridine-cytidine kinase-like 1 isoform X3 n=1 Tax=Varroa jacobsoni TaxID=62625 RepID=UPI000BF6470B|nr:uridine-cytidine kinase-like 1 isoform X3 [Varroa jacobsoni]
MQIRGWQRTFVAVHKRNPISDNGDDFGGRGTIDVQLDFETKMEATAPLSPATSTTTTTTGVSSGPVQVSTSPASPTASRNQNKTHRRERTFSASSNKGDPPVIRTRQRTIYTAGRPPWYDKQGQTVEPFIIGICGGSASGKTTVAKKIIEALNVPWVTLLSMDSFYKVLNEEQHEAANKNMYNFDHPDAFDFELLIDTLKKLKEGKRVEVPVYNFVTHSREKRFKFMYGANVIIFEGILCFAHKELLEMMDMKVFIDTDSDIRLARRLKRDISERGRDLIGCLEQYERFVKPSYDLHIAPTVRHADLVVPRGGENKIAIDLIVQHVHAQLLARGLKLRSTLVEGYSDQPMPTSLHILSETPQVRGIHTFIRNRDTDRDSFIFYSKRLMRLLIEETLSLLPFKKIVVETQQNLVYEGMKSGAGKICGVSILRAGETMEQALCDVLKNVRLGKILIQTNVLTGEPELYYLRLPKDIQDYRIFLMDATVATGAASMMAIRVLLDHDVPEENITLCSLLMASSGVHSIAYAFPKVRIVTTAVDPEINDKFYIKPGIGNFGDRYFGTEAISYS